MEDVKRDVDREINSEELAEFRKLQEELTQARSVIEGEGTKTLELLQAPAIEEEPAKAIENEPTQLAPLKSAEAAKPRRPRKPRTDAAPPSAKPARKPRARRKTPSGSGGEPHG
jgi:DNA-binding protein H-NS